MPIITALGSSASSVSNPVFLVVQGAGNVRIEAPTGTRIYEGPARFAGQIGPGTTLNIVSLDRDVYWEAVPIYDGATPQVSVFAVPGTFTWTRPVWASSFQVIVLGAGGGGGSGRRGAAATAWGGGGGGAGGARSTTTLLSTLQIGRAHV